MNLEFWILCSLFVLCHVIRTTYELLKKSGRITEENRPAFLIVLTAMILLWVSWFGMCPVDPFQVDLPAFIRIIGLVLFILGLVLAVAALMQLRGVEHIDHLVTTGLFALTRHPMYIGFVFWIIGWATYHGSAFSLIPGALAIGNIIFWARLEDDRLLARYGEEYRRYREETLF